MNYTPGRKKRENRIYDRAPADFLLSIRCIASDNGRPRDTNPVPVKTVDISAGGICFISPEEISTNDVFIITDAYSALKLTGLRVLVLSRSMHIGAPYTLCHCRFIGIDFQKIRNILSYVSASLKKEKELEACMKEHNDASVDPRRLQEDYNDRSPAY
jgi:hypothetical protein